MKATGRPSSVSRKKFQISLLDSFKTREIAIHGGVGDIKKPFIDAK